MKTLFLFFLGISTIAVAEEKFILQNPRQTTVGLTAIANLDSLAALVVGSNGLVMRTTDAGVTWIGQQPFTSESLSGIDIYDSALAIISSVSGKIFRSTDNGYTWIAAVSPVTTSVKLSMGSKLVGVGITNNPLAIIRTTDGGQNWIQVASVPALISQASISGVSMADDSVGIIVGNNGTIYRTSDGGATWILLDASSCPTCAGFLEWYVGVDLKASPIGYAAALQGTSILKTTNAGLFWTKVDTFNNSSYSIASSRDGQTAMTVSSYGRSTITTDGGTTWRHVTIPGVPSAIQKYMYDVAVMSAKVMITVGAGGAIARTTDAGATFELVSGITGENIISIAVSPSGYGFASAANGVLLQTMNGGNTWNETSSPLNKPLYGLRYVGTDTFIAVGDQKTIYRAENNGPMQSLVAGGGATLRGVDANSDIIIAVGDSGTIVRRTSNSSEISTVTTSNLHDVKLLRTGAGFLAIAVGKAGTIFRSIDTATTWDQVTSGTSNDLFSLTIVDSLHAAAVGAKGTYLETSDGGLTWTDRDIGSLATSDLVAISLDAHGDGGIIENGGRGLMRTTDGGANWMIEEMPLPSARFALEAHVPHTWFICGPNAIIQKRIHGMAQVSDSISAGQAGVDSSKLFTAMVHNVGSNRLIIGSVTLDSGNVFTIVTTPDTIPAGDSAVVLLRFAPRAQKTYSDKLVIRSDGVRDSVSVTLRGKGVIPIDVVEKNYITSDFAIEIFPNPVNDILHVRWNSQHVLTLEICDMLGRNILQRSSSAGEELFPVSMFLPGVYLLRATDGVRMEVQRFVIN